MNTNDPVMLIRFAAFGRVKLSSGMHDYLTHSGLRSGLTFNSERVPVIYPIHEIFNPRSMHYLLSIRTVFPCLGGRVWYDEQRQVRQLSLEGDGASDFAHIGDNPNAANNKWPRTTYENRILLICILGIDPDYREHVSERRHGQHDDNMLEALKLPDGVEIHLPRRSVDYLGRDPSARQY